MGEGEKPEGLTPEEYRAAEGITEETDKDREARVLPTVEETEERIADKAQRELPNERQPVGVEAELAELNRVGRAKLGFEATEETPADDLGRPADSEAQADLGAMTPRQGGMHQPVGTATWAEAQQAANLERARRESMQQEVTEGMERYRAAYTEVVNLLLLRPRSDTVKERWDQLNANNVRELRAVDAVVKSGQFLDPMVIRAKFDVAAERLTRFAEDADRG